MFQELANVNINIDSNAVQLYNEVNNCFDDFERVDPRLY